MKSPVHYAFAGLAGLTLLSGCGSDEKDASAEGDPAMTGALEDQIMVDPDLAGRNDGAASAGRGSIWKIGAPDWTNTAPTCDDTDPPSRRSCCVCRGPCGTRSRSGDGPGSVEGCAQ